MAEHRHCKQAAFSLVELAIVIVIIGLLIGGIFIGQSMIRSAQLQSAVSDYQKYFSAVHAFQQKYKEIPGDMSDAQDFWGIANSDGTTCVSTATPGSTLTCNGNGNGTINNVPTASNESFRLWQHLVNAGLITGNYDGITHGTGTYSATAVNSPAGKISNSLWMAVYYGTQSANTTLFDGAYGNVFIFGTYLINQQPIGGVLRPDEMFSVDQKIDDGLPGTGKLVVRAFPSGIGGCSSTTDTTNLAATYLVTSTLSPCTMIFRNVF